MSMILGIACPPSALAAALVSVGVRSPAASFGAQTLQLDRPARARVPLLLAEANEAQPALQAVRWFDELSMLEVFYMGDLAHEEGADDAAALEAAIAASGGNVSRFLLPDERTLPQGGETLSALNVCFTVEITDHESGAEMPSGDGAAASGTRQPHHSCVANLVVNHHQN